MQRDGSRHPAFTRVKGLLMLAVAGIGAAAFLLRLQHAQAENTRRACQMNLLQMQGAKVSWSLENHKLPGAVPTDADLYGIGHQVKMRPRCPKGGTYVWGAVGTLATCSIAGHTLPAGFDPKEDRTWPAGFFEGGPPAR